MRRRQLPLVAALLAAPALGACGKKTVDTDKAESEIAKGIQQQTGAKRAKVDCPDDVEAKKGNDFSCDVTADGDRAKVRITQLDDDGNIRWALGG